MIILFSIPSYKHISFEIFISKPDLNIIGSHKPTSIACDLISSPKGRVIRQSHWVMRGGTYYLPIENTCKLKLVFKISILKKKSWSSPWRHIEMFVFLVLPWFEKKNM